MKFGLLMLINFGLVAAVAAKPKQATLDAGAQHYAACVACHGPDGKGMKAGPLVMAPSLPDSAMVKGDPAALALVVLKGIKKEHADYVQQMLALQEAFDDVAMAQVMTYVRHTFGGLDDTITDKQVAKWRKSFNKIPPAVKRGEVAGLVIQSQGAKGLVSDLTWKEYKGSWKKLPDFSALKPTNSGEAKQQLISLDVTKLKDGFGLVFNGTITLPAKDSYEFTVASDDGGEFLVNGKRVAMVDGIHPVTAKSGKVKLPAGAHTFEVRYFEGSGNQELMASVKAKSIGGVISLSKNSVKSGGGRPAGKQILLSADNPGEAVMYRNFISGSNPRGIAVGYPGRVNVCWDADIMNLAVVWRGEFMDAGRHWSGRGQGNQSPAGVDVRNVSDSFPLMVLSTPEQGWENGAYKVSYAYGRDTAVRKDQKSFIGRHPDYTFLGYRLDSKRYPTFSYRFQEMEVKDHFADSGTAERPTLVRTLTFSGSPAAHTYFRILKDASEDGGGYRAGPVVVTVDGAPGELRNKDAVIEVTKPTTLTLTYAWDNPLDLNEEE